MTTMDRLSPLDAMFLHVEDGIGHMHIASCAVLEGPAPPYEEVVALIESKLPLIPRYRQRVRFVPGGLGRPVWVDDPHFRLDYHVRHTALPPPGSIQDLRNLMGRLMSQELDRNRALWETWIVEGLDDGTWALISKVHHCMVDGVSGTDLMAVVLDSERDGEPPEPEEWKPSPEPSDAELLRHAFSDTLTTPAEMVRWGRSLTRHPRRVSGELGEMWQGAQSLSGRLRPNVELSIEGSIGPHRRWAWARSNLDEIKRIRAGLGGTVNDVVLAAITSGFRDLLLSRGDPVEEDTVVRTLIPVSVRSGDDHTPNNQVSGMIAELPVGIDDPVERLDAIRTQMQDLKGSHQADAGKALTDIANVTPPALLAFSLRTSASMLRRAPQRSVNTVTTNVPGPRVPLFACGRELLEYFPFVPLSHGVRTGVAILSYNRKVAFGVTGDWDTVPDIDVLTEGIESGMEGLLEAAGA
jgi:diacylglycerol O-acyltransferase